MRAALRTIILGRRLSIDLVSHTEDTADSAGTTYAMTSFGREHPRRTLIAVIGYRTSIVGGETVSAVTIGGVTATRVLGAATTGANSQGSEIWYAALPTSLSGDVVVTYSGAVPRSAVAVYRLITGNPVPFSSGSANGVGVGLSASIVVPTNGAGIAVYTNRSGGTGNVSWTNANGDYTVTAIETFMAQGAGKIAPGFSGSVSASIASGSVSDSLSLASWAA